MSEKTKRLFEITGYDSTRKMFRQTISANTTSIPELEILLQRLAARHLSDGEIIAASLRKNDPGYAPFLEITTDNNHLGRIQLSTQGNPHYVARLV
jgi:hypothetical protein